VTIDRARTHPAPAILAIAAAVLALAATPAQARTVRVAASVHGAWAALTVHAAPEQLRAARATRGRAHRSLPARGIRRRLAHGPHLRLRLPTRLRRARGRLVVSLRLAPETALSRTAAAGTFRVRSDSRRARFRCRVDRGAWQKCATRWRPALGAGRHRLEARAHDRDGLSDRTAAHVTAVIPGPGASEAAPTPAPAWPLPTGSAFDPFGSASNFANARLPDAVALNSAAVSSAAAGELQRQANVYGTYLNSATFTAPIVVVPPDQPLTPVLCKYGSTPCVSQMRQMMLGVSTTGADLHGGLPIPPGYVPAAASDTDAEVAFYQPGYVSPAGYRGRFYEAWKLRLNPAYDPSRPVSPANPRWTAGSGGRVVGSATAPGHYRNWTVSGYRYSQPGDPDSTYQGASWGVLATGLFIASDEVRREDCVAGRIDHAIGLLVHDAKVGHIWPAQRGDGDLASSPIVEGMRLRFPASMPKPRFSNRFASMLFDAAQHYGLVIDDKTYASVGVRIEPASNGHAAPECMALLDGAHGYTALSGFPWSKLQVIVTGSDALPNQP
jgi:hypothetical protein